MADKRGILSVALNQREVVIRSDAENLAYLRHHWRGAYVVIRPSQPGDTWKAIAAFGHGDELIGASADELLGLIRRHYGPSTPGYPFTAREIPGR